MHTQPGYIDYKVMQAYVSFPFALLKLKKANKEREGNSFIYRFYAFLSLIRKICFPSHIVPQSLRHLLYVLFTSSNFQTQSLTKKPKQIKWNLFSPYIKNAF